MKAMATSRRDLSASVAGNYMWLEPMSAARATSAFEWATKPLKSQFMGVEQPVQSENQVCVCKGRARKGVYRDKQALLEAWCECDPRFGRLFEEFQRSGCSSFEDWRPARRINRTEEAMLEVSFAISRYQKASIGAIEFETVQRARLRVKHDNSGFMYPYIDEDSGDRTVGYGRILKIFEHELYAAAKKRIFCEVEWFDSAGTHPLTHLQLLRRDSDPVRSIVPLINGYHENVCYLKLSFDDSSRLFDDDRSFVAIRRTNVNIDLDWLYE